MEHSLSIRSFFDSKELSFGKYCAKPKDPYDLGIIVNLSNGFPPSKNQLTMACPDSWTATIYLSSSDTVFFFYKPAMTLSEAISKSSGKISFLFFLAAKSAASLHKLANSAPLNPGVRVANLLA